MTLPASDTSHEWSHPTCSLCVWLASLGTVLRGTLQGRADILAVLSLLCLQTWTDKPGGLPCRNRFPNESSEVPFIRPALIFFQINCDINVQTPVARVGWSFGTDSYHRTLAAKRLCPGCPRPAWPSGVLMWSKAAVSRTQELLPKIPLQIRQLTLPVSHMMPWARQARLFSGIP